MPAEGSKLNGIGVWKEMLKVNGIKAVIKLSKSGEFGAWNVQSNGEQMN